MFRCPKCHAELPGDAKFCTHCGFNQTNARMMAMKDQGGQPPAARPGPANQGGSVPQPVRQSTPPAPQQGNSPQSSLRSYASPPATPPTNTPAGRGGPASPGTPQPPRNMPNTPPAQAQPMPQTPMPPPGGPQGWNGQGRPPEQVVRTSTPPNANYPMSPGNPLSAPRQTLWDGPSLDDIYNDPAMLVTSQAAEHWRASWRGRQKAEAGPAVGIARGQAEVAEPLLAMQHSIARMRAVMGITTQPKTENNKGFTFWAPVILLGCLIVGLLGYTATTFIGNGTPTLAAQGTYPRLMISGATTTFTAGQAIHVVGTFFSQNGPVSLSLDSSTTNGRTQTLQSDEHGNIKGSLTVPADALAGNYTLKAVDDTMKGTSFLPVHVLPTNTANTTTLEAVGANQLNFTATVANPDPKGQAVTLKNPGDTTVRWSATTFSEYTSTDPKKPISTDAANWLLLNDGHTSGTLQAQGTDVLQVSANAMSLIPSPDHPYIGYVVITTQNAQNQTGQMLLKVSLLLKPTGNELIVTPSTTLVVIRDPDGSCTKNPPSITLANLGNAPVNYTVKAADTNSTNYFTFSQNATGIVYPAGSTTPPDTNGKSTPTDVQSVTVACHNIQAGVTLYRLSVYPGTSAVITLNVAVVSG